MTYKKEDITVRLLRTSMTIIAKAATEVICLMEKLYRYWVRFSTSIRRRKR